MSDIDLKALRDAAEFEKMCGRAEWPHGCHISANEIFTLLDRLESAERLHKEAVADFAAQSEQLLKSDSDREAAERRAEEAEKALTAKPTPDWQARCLERGFEYVRESDDHYVLADVPEMAALLGELLGVEVRSKDNESYGETVRELRDALDAAADAHHRAYEAEKERDALRKDAALLDFLQKFRPQIVRPVAEESPVWVVSRKGIHVSPSLRNAVAAAMAQEGGK